MAREIGMGSRTEVRQDQYWEDYLDRGERILWAGRPGRGLRFTTQGMTTSAFGLFFFGFSVFWMYGASGFGQFPAGGFNMIFPLFGLPFVAVGFYLVFGHWFYDAYARGKTQYALTDKRALIAKNLFGKSLKTYKLDGEIPIELKGDGPYSVNFAKEMRRGKNRTYSVDIGFRYIDDGREVYDMVRKIAEQNS